MLEGRSGRARVLPALVLAALVLAVLGASLLGRRQLGMLGGLTDEWMMLGANVAVHGTLGLENEPWLLRPPGYPAFIAAPLFLAGAPRAVTLAYLGRAAPLIFAAQAATATLGAVLLFLWLCERMRARHAFAAALVFALNPGSVVLVGLLQYGVLHATGIVAALWALDRGLREWPRRRRPLVFAGAAWGLVTLVRPVTLLLPPFLLLALVLRRPRLPLRSALAGTLVLCGAGAAVLAPWTLRNLAVSGRFVPVNLQGLANLWGATVKPLPTDVDAYRWQALGEEQLDLLERVSGRRAYDLLTYVRLNAELEQAYGREAWRNLRRQPHVYAGNVARNLGALLFDTSSVLLPVFREIQRPGVEVTADWFDPGAQPRFVPAPLLRAGFRGLVFVLALFSALGLVGALRSRQGPLWATAAVGACVLAAHALTHLEFTYFYVKLPFLAILGFGGLASLAPDGSSPRTRAAVDAAAAVLALWALGLTAALLRP